MVGSFVFFITFLLVFSGNLLAQQQADSSQSVESVVLPAYRSLTKGGFTFSLNGSVHNVDRIYGWSLTSQAGYLVADRLVAGFQVSVANRSSKIGSSSFFIPKRGGVMEYAVTPEVYARYYVLPFRITPFVQVSSGYNFGEFSTDSFVAGVRSSINTNNFVMLGALGLSFRAGKNMGLQAQYNVPLMVDPKVNDMIRGNRFRLGLSLYIR